MLNKSYRQEIKQVSTVSFRPEFGVNGTIQLRQTGYGGMFGDGNENRYSAVIHADELMNTARKCLTQLGNIAGVQYKICVIVDGKAHFVGGGV